MSQPLPSEHDSAEWTHNDNEADYANDDDDGVDDCAEQDPIQHRQRGQLLTHSQWTSLCSTYLNIRAGTFLFPITLLSSAVQILLPA
jgi:hypothetical protein